MVKTKQKASTPLRRKNLEAEVGGVYVDKKALETVFSRLYQEFRKDLYGLEKRLDNKYKNIKKDLIGEYKGLLKKYDRVLESLAGYKQTLNGYGAEGIPEDTILKSPTMEHYKHAVVYREQLKAGISVLSRAYEDLKEWFSKYGTPLAGFRGFLQREKALAELGKYKTASREGLYNATEKIWKNTTAIILAFAASTLLALSTANITGLAIANKTIESVYPIGAGFVLLIIALILLLRRVKH